ncbi:MAG: sigma 54-interacting transcriptional regulator, partial [Chromatocurvus sp.]
MAAHDNTNTVTGPGRVSLSGGGDAEVLVFTVAFHPCPELIGARAEYPVRRSGNAITLGRDAPDFRAAEGRVSRALLDVHVSRRAVRIKGGGLQWQISRLQGSSRLCVDGRDTFADTSLDAVQLRAGVRLTLAHSVVLLLRLEPAAAIGHACASVDGMLGTSAYMVSLSQQVSRAAAIDSDVLLLGPTGTGKDLLARAIHARSRRAAAPMVAVNVAAIPAELSAASLFGSARGAFTGATDRRLGYFEQANGGTLFLDEIGDAPERLQPQLLRALEQREVQVVG